MRMYQHTYAPKTDLRWVLLGVRRHPCPMTCPAAAVFPHLAELSRLRLHPPHGSAEVLCLRY